MKSAPGTHGDDTQAAPSYTESSNRLANANDLLPPTEHHDTIQEPPPDYEVSFQDAYAQWISVERASQEISALEPVLKFAKANLSKEQVVLSGLKEKSAALFETLHKKKNPIANLLMLASKKGKAKAAAPAMPLEPNLLCPTMEDPPDGDDLPSYAQLRGNDTLSAPSPTEKAQVHDSSANQDPGAVNNDEGETLGEHRSRRRRGSNSTVGTSENTASSSKKWDKIDKRERAKFEFESAHAEEMRHATTVEALEEKVRQLREQRETLQTVVSTRENTWLLLCHSAEKKAPVAFLATRIGNAIELLTTADAEHGLAKQATADLTRARLTIQHAHHYFTNALRTCDAVRGTSLNHATVGMIGGEVAAMSKLYDYRAAVTLASKAQVCLNECFRVMEPHVHTFPQERRDDYDTLRTMGLMQILKIYNLLYGGRIIDSGVSTTIKVMLDRQEKAFVHLTNLAVSVQDRVPRCELEEKVALERRNEARNRLIQLWLENYGIAQ